MWYPGSGVVLIRVFSDDKSLFIISDFVVLIEKCACFAGNNQIYVFSANRKKNNSQRKLGLVWYLIVSMPDMYPFYYIGPSALSFPLKIPRFISSDH